jgi:hypothetical protein
MTDNPTIRSRVWALLRKAGGRRVAVAALALALNVSPEAVLAEMLPEMMDGTIYCEGAEDGPGLTPRRFPEGDPR